jgi:hypothetical protein
MKSPTRWVLIGALATVMSGCEIFENQTPEFVAFRMSGEAGDQVTVVYSKAFVAAVNELGTTELRVFLADTVVHTLPIDTIIDVRIERQIFLRAYPLELGDTIPVSVNVEVNDRSIFDRSGDLLPDEPWHFLYRFNAPPTQTIEIVV